MSDANASLALLLVVILPLLVAGAVAFGRTRLVALRLAPWAALPALATAGALADNGLRLPDVMLGSALVLDATGRVFLLLSATLWLAVGLLARSQLHTAGSARFAVLLLLAMAGGLGLALATDALLFFAAGTLAAYALYGLLVLEADRSAQTAGRVLVVLMVVSDLLVFELLLILSQAAGSVDFASLRQALVNTDDRGLMLGLLAVGFGIKTGVVGVHFWLAPAFVTAVPAVRPALVGFMLGAGLLGWLRLLPLGEIHWARAGDVLQWLSWLTLGYAFFTGLLQTHYRSILAYAAMALTSLWLTALGSALRTPEVWNWTADAMLVAVLQSGFALAALLLLDRRTSVGGPVWLRRFALGVMWSAALLLVSAPVGVAASLAKLDGTAAAQLFWATAAIAFLAVRSLLLVFPVLHVMRDASPAKYVMRQPTQASTAISLLVVGGLTGAALLAASYNLVGLSMNEFWLAALTVSAAALAAWLSVARPVPRLPALYPGDLLVPISNGLAGIFSYARNLANVRLPFYRDGWIDLVRRLWSVVDWRTVVGWFESRLDRWPTALITLILLGLITAGLTTSQ